MTIEEIATLLRLPVPHLLELAKDPMSLVAILNLAVNKGTQIGQVKTHESYHMMMTGYNETAITTWSGINENI